MLKISQVFVRLNKKNNAFYKNLSLNPAIDETKKRSAIENKEEILRDIKQHQTPELTRKLESVKDTFLSDLVNDKRKQSENYDYHKYIQKQKQNMKTHLKNNPQGHSDMQKAELAMINHAKGKQYLENLVHLIRTHSKDGSLQEFLDKIGRQRPTDGYKADDMTLTKKNITDTLIDLKNHRILGDLFDVCFQCPDYYNMFLKPERCYDGRFIINEILFHQPRHVLHRKIHLVTRTMCAYEFKTMRRGSTYEERSIFGMYTRALYHLHSIPALSHSKPPPLSDPTNFQRLYFGSLLNVDNVKKTGI